MYEHFAQTISLRMQGNLTKRNKTRLVKLGNVSSSDPSGYNSDEDHGEGGGGVGDVGSVAVVLGVGERPRLARLVHHLCQEHRLAL